MDNIKLGVVLPVYRKDNSNHFIIALKSLLEQSFSSFKLCIVIDGPIESNIEKVLASCNDSRIFLIRLKSNRGLPYALNAGIKGLLEIGCDFIARMDADDISDKERLNKQISFLNKHKEYDLVGSSAYLIDMNSETIGLKRVKQNFGFSDLIKKCELIHPSVVFRSTFFEKVGFYDVMLKKSQDYDLWLRAAKLGVKMCNLNEMLLSFRYDPNIIDRRKNEQEYNILIKKKHLKGFRFLFSIIPNVIIMFLPNMLINKILNYRIKKS